MGRLNGKRQNQSNHFAPEANEINEYFASVCSVLAQKTEPQKPQSN